MLLSLSSQTARGLSSEFGQDLGVKGSCFYRLTLKLPDAWVAESMARGEHLAWRCAYGEPRQRAVSRPQLSHRSRRGFGEAMTE